MSNMISELKVVGHEMTDEQQVQAVICSFPGSWEHMCVNLTHNNNIKTFDDIACHVELEKDRLLARGGQYSGIPEIPEFFFANLESEILKFDFSI